MSLLGGFGVRVEASVFRVLIEAACSVKSEVSGAVANADVSIGPRAAKSRIIM